MEEEDEVIGLHHIGQQLNQTLSSDADAIRAATESLDRSSLHPHFPFHLLSIATGGENQGQRVAAATYLKNFTRRNIEGGETNSKVSKEFRSQLIRALLHVESAVLKVLLEAFQIVVVSEFVQQNSWPELVPELRSSIEKSNHISNGSNCEWSTMNALMVLQAVIRPFQYFLNPKVAKEAVPPQLEIVAKEILAPLLTFFHHLVEKVLSIQGAMDMETERILLIICKCVYLAVRSYMPSALCPLLASFCHSLIRILGSLSFGWGVNPADGYLLRLKAGKRSLLIFCALLTRHRKYSEKLMPEMTNCALKMVRYSSNISVSMVNRFACVCLLLTDGVSMTTEKLDFMSERIISLAFDVISRVLETGPGWKLVSPHFSLLLDSAIFPALVLNDRDISEWEEDTDEFIRKNLPSELEQISGWREDLFTARKSAINLLGVISMSKGQRVVSSNTASGTSKRKKGEKSKRNNQQSSMGELLVLPFLSKFPVPSMNNIGEARILNDYFGVLMAYGGLLDFLREQSLGYVATLVRTRVLPIYFISGSSPYLVASVNWVLGELVSCLPEEMNADVYSFLLKALAVSESADTTYYPVLVSAAGAISALIENDYLPPEWLPLVQVVISRIGDEDEENIVLFQLLHSVVEAGTEDVSIHIPYIVSSLVGIISKYLHPSPDPWPQVVVLGFDALAVMAETWENSKAEGDEQNKSSETWLSGQAAIGKALSALLQQAWLRPMHSLGSEVSPPSSCLEHMSTLLRCIMLTVMDNTMIIELKLSELLSVWSELIGNWNDWEESEHMSVFGCIEEVVRLNGSYRLQNLFVKEMPSPPAPPVPERSIIESIGTFVSEAIQQYPSAMWRACSCIHTLLHIITYSFETEGVKQSLAIVFSQAAFSRFQESKDKPCSLWKPLLLAISSCYLCYPDIVEGVLEKAETGSFGLWASSLAFACTSSFEPGLSLASELKLVVVTLVKVVGRLLEMGIENSSGGQAQSCFLSLMEASLRLKEVQEEMGEDEDDEGTEDEEDEDEEETDYDDEESDSDEHEETEEEFMERYAKEAAGLADATVIEEGDVEDQELKIDLGPLEEVDLQKLVFSLMERHQRSLLPVQALPSQLVSKFLNAFPEYSLFFQQFR